MANINILCCNECCNPLTDNELAVYPLQWQHSGDMYCTQHETREQFKQDMALAEKVLSGIPVNVYAERTDMHFTITSIKKYGLRWYTIKQNGKAVKGKKGILLDKATVIDWCNNLVEISEE